MPSSVYTFTKSPFRLGLYEFGVVIHLGFVAGELLVAVGGNTGISSTRRFCAATFGRCVSGLMVAGIMVTLGIVLAPL